MVGNLGDIDFDFMLFDLCSRLLVDLYVSINIAIDYIKNNRMCLECLE